MREDGGMGRGHTTFLGYRIYRKKFLVTAAVVLLLSVIVFFGMLVFFVNIWMTDLQKEAQNRFLEGERRLGNMQAWTLDYVDGLYENKRLMDDVEALLSAMDEAQYLQARRDNSLASALQIRYFPADLKKMFTDSRFRVSAVILHSVSGMKAVWPTAGGDVCLSFDFRSLEEMEGVGFWGSIPVSRHSIRDPKHLNRTIGTMEFWVNIQELYGTGDGFLACWALRDADGTMLCDSGLTQRQTDRIRQAAREDGPAGWLRDADRKLFYYAKFESGQGLYTYFMTETVSSALRNNLYVVLVLLAALVLVDTGVLVSSYVGIRVDAAFLATIMSMLSDMEEGSFERMRDLELPSRRRENEYEIIAVAMKKMGMKLKGYIETEYILKLKEQETQMRALQHQINPHFLYNTLETLRARALQQGERDIADAIAMLGSLYRARMHKKESVLLQEEFELLEMYLKIMELRYGDKFVYQTQLDSEIASMRTVTFWLQPLAENFFTHGFDRESEYNLLIVNGYAVDGGARIEILDNGLGAGEEQLPAIRQNMYEGNDDPEADIGLRNVYMRLCYFYGDGFSMDIGNNAEGGFRICVFLPVPGTDGQ